jgi:leader peptidase (prepilin peptidase)/N-methyltransferase
LSEQGLFTLFAFFFGTVWGSFANVVIVRLPQDKSVSLPGSHCPRCKTPIPWYYNIPIFSWLALRGKCHNCQTPISFRYPIVELIMGLVFAAIYYKYDWSISTLEYLIFAFAVITSSFIDLDHMILPDRFTLSGIVIGLLGALINPEREFIDALLGVLIGGGFLLAVAYFYFAIRKIEGMGGGDIKLLGWIGAVCGIQSLYFVILFSSLTGLLVGSVYMLSSKKGLKTGIPFGPYLAGGALVYILFDVSFLMKLLFPFMA